MQFIKQNLFMTILIAAVVVGSALLFLLTGSFDPAKTEALKKALQVSADAAQQANASKVNAKMLDQASLAVKKEKQATEEVIRKIVEMNRAGYSVPILAVGADGSQMVPAFPFDTRQYDQYGLYFKFTDQYVRQIDQLREQLRPATPPTNTELTDLIARKSREAAAAGGVDPLVLAAVGGGVAVDQVRRDAMNELRIGRAQGGLVFVDVKGAVDDPFDRFFREPIPFAEPEKLWAAMVNYWVQSDIVAAINQTNADHIAKQGIQNPTVLNSAIKRLVKIDVTEDYFGGTGNVSGGVAGGPAAWTPSAPVSDATRLAAEEDARMLRAAGLAVTELGGGDTTDLTASKDMGLTQMISTQDYDVVRYSFAVIMPVGQILALEENLQKRNLHTILQVSMVSPDFSTTTGTPAYNANGDTNPYTYGPEPVMKVTITGQLLLLTNWSRGTWEAEKTTDDGQTVPAGWSKQYPPLAPVAVLKTLPAEALREEDNKRMEPTEP